MEPMDQTSNATNYINNFSAETQCDWKNVDWQIDEGNIACNYGEHWMGIFYSAKVRKLMRKSELSELKLIQFFAWLFQKKILST